MMHRGDVSDRAFLLETAEALSPFSAELCRHSAEDEPCDAAAPFPETGIPLHRLNLPPFSKEKI